MEIESIFITGANKGIGLEFVRQLVRLSKPPRFIFATYRSENTLEALRDIKQSSRQCEVVLIKMDITMAEDIIEARKIVSNAVGESGLTLLINNAAAIEYNHFPEITKESLINLYRSNTVGAVLLTQEMYPLLQKAASRNSSTGMRVSTAAVLNISSMSGSITRTKQGVSQDLVVPAYKISKAALNMAMRIIAADVEKDGILIILMCPGWVKTDMGTEQAHITVEESVSAILKTLPNLNESHHGTFMDRFGNPYSF